MGLYLVEREQEGGRRAWVLAWGSVVAGVVGVWGGVGFAMDSVVWFSAGCGLVCLGVCFGGGLGGVVRRAALWLAVAALMGGVVTGRLDVGDGDRLDVMVGIGGANKRAVVRVRGVVVEGVEWSEGRREVWEPVMWAGVRGRMRVEVREVFDGSGWVESSGEVRVVVPGGRMKTLTPALSLREREEEGDEIEVGDVVEVMGVMRGGSSGKRNVGDRDWGMVAAMEDRVGVISVTGGGMVDVVGEADGVWWSVRRWRAALRGRAMGALGIDGDLDRAKTLTPALSQGERGEEKASSVREARISPLPPNEDARGRREDAGKVVIGALLLGERTVEGREVERSFARVGVGHVLAVSGFHVALLAGMCVVLVRVVGGFGWGVRLIGGRVWVEGVVVCLVLLGMWVLVPVRVPVVRAMVLIGAVMVGRAVGRRYDTMAVLGWVAVGLMVWRPMDVFGLGFQLSVGITGLLVWMGRGSREEGRPPPSAAQTPPPQAWGRRLGRRFDFENALLKWVWGLLKVNFACWLVALPGIVWHVGVVSVVGVLMAVVVALMAGVLMGAGYVQVLVGVLVPGVGERTRWVVEGMGEWLAGFVGWVDSVGWSSVRGVNLGVGWTVAATALAWVVVTRPKEVSRRVLLIAVVVLIGWGAGSWSVRSRVDGVRVEMVDVGDGSAYLVRSGGESLLYDCGSLDYRVGGTVERVAHRRGVRRIGTVIVSHDNVDHYNGLVELARSGVGFDRVYISAVMDQDPSAAWGAVREELETHGAEVVVMGRGDSFAFGSARVVCVGGVGGVDGGVSDNDASLVVRVEMDVVVEGEVVERAVLMTGDIGGAGMGAIDEADLEGVVVMELPHHGSISGSSGGSSGGAARGFVARVDPEVVLQSTGIGRVDGRWDQMRDGRAWFASAVGGGAWVEIGGDGVVESGWSVGGRTRIEKHP
ncbi:MAG: ComEC/Rec2 family competence protein [Phycisphaerales bacterium]